MSVSRRRIIETLSRRLEARSFLRAAWLGGSDATGRTDAWSDVDLQLVVSDDSIEEAFAAVCESMETLSPIALRLRLPQPTWHGHEQEFLRLKDSEPEHFLDVVVMKCSSDDWFLEPERHGHVQVLFDKDGLAKPAPFDRQRHVQKMAGRLPQLRTSFDLFQNLVSKAVRRGAIADAMASYLTFTIRPLVELLRMRHCPERYDFGLRYLDRDLPSDLHEEIESLVLLPSLEKLEESRRRAEERFHETLRAYDAGEWSLRSSREPGSS